MGKILLYNYDFTGRRSLKTNTGSTIRYINKYQEQEITTNSGTLETKTSNYIYLGDLKIATIETTDTSTGTTLIYHHSDHLGGASIDTNPEGTILQSSDYKPFGETRTVLNSTDYENKYLFTGKEEDLESGLQYFEARYYDNVIGRFESIDRVFWEVGNTGRGVRVMINPQQLNGYSYVANNPLKYVDPSGQTADTVIDAGFVAYDAARVVKNGVEVVTGWVFAGYGAMTGDENKVKAGLEGAEENMTELNEAGDDAAMDSIAFVIPGYSASINKVDDVIKYGDEVVEILENKQVRETLERIESGTKKYGKDGTTFYNKDKVLPEKNNGYYKERTVETPGSETRGSKRIVTGEQGEMYYTSDHYDSFTEIK